MVIVTGKVAVIEVVTVTILMRIEMQRWYVHKMNHLGTNKAHLLGAYKKQSYTLS